MNYLGGYGISVSVHPKRRSIDFQTLGEIMDVRILQKRLAMQNSLEGLVGLFFLMFFHL